MKVTKVITREISRCYNDCPYFTIGRWPDGWPGSVMICDHPNAPDDGYIISRPQCDEGFPEKCPLLKVTNES